MRSRQALQGHYGFLRSFLWHRRGNIGIMDMHGALAEGIFSWHIRWSFLALGVWDANCS